ncbi:unnamed protein product [Larinioides sclopetarius]|uniref:Uncharacterized protein n=1 Tax=Larinioides sclopetarius TaxID=280406 RepID=A0AAV1ZY10_9ARAC
MLTSVDAHRGKHHPRSCGLSRLYTVFIGCRVQLHWLDLDFWCQGILFMPTEANTILEAVDSPDYTQSSLDVEFSYTGLIWIFGVKVSFSALSGIVTNGSLKCTWMAGMDEGPMPNRDGVGQGRRNSPWQSTRSIGFGTLRMNRGLCAEFERINRLGILTMNRSSGSWTKFE